MNCLTVRASLLADPGAYTAQLHAHLHECPHCRTFAAAMMHGDALLRSAIDVPVPKELAARILLQTQIRQRRCAPVARLRQWFASHAVWPGVGLAAALSAVLVVALSAGPRDDASNLNWGQVALAHAIAEPGALSSTADAGRPALEKVLHAYGLALHGDPGIVRFLERCAVPGGRGTHIVIETGEHGRVTLLLPPPGKRPLPGAARGEGLSAQMIDIAGVGVGIVASDRADLPGLAALLARQLVRRA